MKREWDTNGLIDNFTLTTEEKQWLVGKRSYNQLGCAVLLKFFQYEGRFPEQLRDIPMPVREYIAQQLDSSVSFLEQYDWMGRTMRDDRAAIRVRLGYRLDFRQQIPLTAKNPRQAVSSNSSGLHPEAANLLPG